MSANVESSIRWTVNVNARVVSIRHFHYEPDEGCILVGDSGRTRQRAAKDKQEEERESETVAELAIAQHGSMKIRNACEMERIVRVEWWSSGSHYSPYTMGLKKLEVE